MGGNKNRLVYKIMGKDLKNISSVDKRKYGRNVQRMY